MIRSRFFGRLLAAFTTSIGISAVAFYLLAAGRVEQIILEETERALLREARMLAPTARSALAGDAGDDLQNRIATLGRDVGTRFTVIAPDGSVLADSKEEPARMDNHGRRPEVERAAREGTGTSTRFSRTLSLRMMYVALPVREGNRLLGFVRTALPLTTIDEHLGGVRWAMAVGAGIAAVCAFALSLLLARRITSPVTSMTDAARAIARGDPSPQLPSAEQDEIGDLARALRTMDEQLRERIATIAADRNRFEAILGSMVEGVVAIDSEERVLHINAVASRILNADPDRAIGRRIWESTRIRAVPEVLAEAMREGSPRTVETHLADRSPEVFLQLRAAPLREGHGTIGGALVVMHDVTALRRLETIRRDFVANASHELKTPLTAIRGAVETVLDDPEIDPARRQQFLESARNHVDRLSSIVRDLLLLSRAEAPETGLSATVAGPIDLRAPVREALAELAAAAERKGIRIETDLPPVPIPARADRESARIIAENLIDNAIQYSLAGRTVRVRIHLADGAVVLDVADEGIGIEPRDRERIFERFYRVDPARSRELGGTGLGLSIVRNLVQDLGGSISVTSTPGQGSRFQVRLPAD